MLCSDWHILQRHGGFCCSDCIDLVREKLAKSSAVCTPSSIWLLFCSPIMPDRVYQSFFVSLLLSAILVCQCWWFFSSYTLYIFLSWSIHNRQSAFDRVLRYRLSSILECLRLLRHSASNHGVRAPNLRRIFTAGQCLFSGFSNVVSYRSASSSTGIQINESRFVESGGFQVSLKRTVWHLLPRSSTIYPKIFWTGFSSVHFEIYECAIGQHRTNLYFI